jgi:serine/threonine-protein kinase ATR
MFRIACEITMGLLRENKDTLMTVLDPFIHDPLVEWEDEKRKIVSSAEKVGFNKLTSTDYPGTTSKSTSCSEQVSNRLARAR